MNAIKNIWTIATKRFMLTPEPQQPSVWTMLVESARKQKAVALEELGEDSMRRLGAVRHSDGTYVLQFRCSLDEAKAVAKIV